MLSPKTLHFFGKVLSSRPMDLPDMMRRRAIEALRKAPRDLAATHIGDVRFDVDLSLHALARKYYFQTHEMFLETIFRRHLKPGAIFVDIGANMGYWSAFSASIVGRKGAVHAFEPVPAFHRSLERLRDNNPAFEIHANRMALGAEPGALPMAVVQPSRDNFDNFDTNIGSSSILPGFLDHETGLTETIDVPVTTFDHYAAETGLDLDRIGLIKIDVEGYESYCFDGMRSVLERPGRKVPILCEVLTDPARHAMLDGANIV
jgi:FkbM family methyltransferase